MKKPTWQTQGTEPDYRFSLANERTFLAWIRTAFALLGGGLVVAQLALHTRQPLAMIAAGFALGLLAIAISAGAYARWKANEIAMRLGVPLPSSFSISFAAAGIVALSALLVGALGLELFRA